MSRWVDHATLERRVRELEAQLDAIRLDDLQAELKRARDQRDEALAERNNLERALAEFRRRLGAG